MTPTQTFISTLRQTPTLSSTLQTNLRLLQANLQQFITVLTYPKTVADDLTKLTNLLSATIDVLTFVSIVPEIGQAASALKSTLQVLQAEVTPAKNAAVALERRVNRCGTRSRSSLPCSTTPSALPATSTRPPHRS